MRPLKEMPWCGPRAQTRRVCRKASWVEALRYANMLAVTRIAIYRPAIQSCPSGEWNVWWVEA